ncbi:MAG: hypothetical protein GY796_36335, partial [Chloroflexi bacterium]|nr:hypothetical protein [Chloroflexota bacterium]
GDILVGANNQAYLLLGEAIPVWSQVDLDKYAAAIITANAAAITLAGVGDVDDDQLADFAIGDGNSVYLFTGQTSFSAHSTAALTLTDAAATFSSSNNPPAIVGLGDVSGDSLADFVYQSGSSPQIVLGSASQNWTTQSIPAFSPAPDGFLTAAGDVDRDGRHDLLVGNANGDAYLIVGNDLNNVAATFTGVDTAASSLYAAGADLNSDGASDVLLVPSASAAAGLGLNGLMNTPHIRQEWLSVSGTAGETNGRAFSPLAVGASDIYVDDDYCAACANDGYTWGVTAFADVQTAVNAASPGNTIGLQPGVYSSFTVSADNLTIGSTTLADTVFIDGGGGTYGVYINNADGVQLTDLTIRNAQYGVQLEDAGTDGWQTAADKIILDHLFIYDVTSNPIYMNLQSSLSLQQSTLVGSNNHIGTYGNPATISPDPAWSTESSNSNAATDSNSGLVALGNDLLVLGSNDSNNISVYDTSGNSWSSISNGLSGIADGLSVKSAFTTENGEIWALDATDFNGGLPDRAWSLAYVSANEIYVGGDFNNVGGNADIDNIAKWDGTDWTVVGARSDSNYPGSTIIDMDIDSSGRVYVVGSFGLRRFNGSIWEDLGDACFNCPATNQGWMEAIAINGNDVYVGGKFNGVVSGGATVDANSIARWNNGTWYMVGGSTSGCNGLTGYVGSQEQVTELAIFGSFLYVGGNFYGVYNGSCGSALNADSIARYYLPTSQFMTMQVSGYSGGDGGLYGSSYRSPETFLVIGNKLYVGGEFSTVDWGDGVQHNTANFVSYGLSG